MEKTRTAIIGLGNRGKSILKNVLLKLPSVTVTAVCDSYADRAEEGRNLVNSCTGITPFCTTDSDEIFARDDVDAVIVTTGWETHVPLAIASMRAGKPVGVEVGGAYTLEDCFELVRVYEETKTPIMLMENCCFEDDELAVTAMTRDGVFGDIVHASGAYGHDLRYEVGYGELNRHYRLRNYLTRNCENYPTHELGPIAKLLQLGRGNRMISLCSMASSSKGMHEYISKRQELEKLAAAGFAQGDIFHTLIKCENGESILLKLDTTLPRFYSRELSVRGTRGLYDMNSAMVFIDGGQEKEYWNPYRTVENLGGNFYRDWKPKYQAPVWRAITEEERKAGHGGMDYIIYREFFNCVREGREMPIDVYDMASWMSVTCLSAVALKEGRTVEIPDFTHGLYKTREKRDVTKLS